MIYQKIYLGSWAFGSNIHLKELYQTLSTGKSLNFSEKEIKSWLKGFNIEKVEYIPQAFNSVKGILKNNIEFDVLEDGIMLVSKDIKDVIKDQELLLHFMDTEMKPLWKNISSRDVALTVMSTGEEKEEKVQNKRPVVLVVSEAKEEDLVSIFNMFDSVVFKKVGLEKGSVWIGDDLVILNDVNINQYDLLESVRYLMFARLYELKLNDLLCSQRKLWNKIEGIRSRKFYKSTELPVVRDTALSIQNQANFYSSFSRQTKQMLLWREKFINDYLTDHVLSNLFKEFFLSLRSTQLYLEELWIMTQGHANDTVQSVSLLYSDNQQKELRTLQKLFLISAVVSVLSLGTLAGSNRFAYNTDGDIIGYSKILAWHWGSFVLYGIVTILASVIIYYSLYMVFTRFKRPERVLNKEKNKK